MKISAFFAPSWRYLPAAFADGDKVVWTYANDRHDAIRRFATGDLQDQFVETPGR